MTGPCKGGAYCYPLFAGGYTTKPGQIIAGQPQAPITVGVGNITGFVCSVAPQGKPGEKFWSGACPGTWGPNGPFYDNGGGGTPTLSTGACIPPNPPPPPVGFRRVYYKITIPGNGPKDANGNTPTTYAWKASYVPDNSTYQTPPECPCGKTAPAPSGGTPTLPSNPSGPITGPSKPPAEGCGPVMPDGGEASRYLFGHDAGQHFSKGAVTGQFLSIPKHDGATASSQPNWTQKPRVIKNGDGIYQLWDGTADGDVWLAPGELYDYHLYGDGTLAGGKWPARISEAGLKVLSAARATSSHGDNAVGSIGLGKPTRNAGLASGWEAKLDFTDSATEPHIDWISKDADGVSPSAGEFRIHGNVSGIGALSASSAAITNTLTVAGLEINGTDVDPTGAVPVGSIVMYGAALAPTGWLLCDGSAVSRTTYAALFAVIGTTYGVGDGSTTFNVPDTQGRSPVGYGSGASLTSRSLNDGAGTETHTLTSSEMPVHSHQVTVGDGGSGHTHSNATNAAGVASDQASTAGVSSGNAGGGNAHNNMHPFRVVNFIIKT